MRCFFYAIEPFITALFVTVLVTQDPTNAEDPFNVPSHGFHIEVTLFSDLGHENQNCAENGGTWKAECKVSISNVSYAFNLAWT